MKNISKNMPTITQADLVSALKTYQSTFFPFVAETPQRIFNKGKGDMSMLATIGIDPDRMTKVSKVVAMVGTSAGYQKMVNKRRADAGLPKDFESKGLSGVEWVVPNLLLVNDAGELQLRVSLVTNHKAISAYWYEGAMVDVKNKKFDVFRKPFRKAPVNQGIEDVIEVKNYKLSNIKAVKLGTWFRVVP